MRNLWKIIKHCLRNTFWSVYGRRLKNPPLPKYPKIMIFLCLGDICRSAYAYHYSSTRIARLRHGLDIELASAGLRVKDAGSPESAVSAAKIRGVDLSVHRPTQITEKKMQSADMVLAMEPRQADMLRMAYPQFAGKVYLLPFFENGRISAYHGWDRYHIEDPYGRSGDEINACFARIERCVAGLMTRLSTPG